MTRSGKPAVVEPPIGLGLVWDAHRTASGAFLEAVGVGPEMSNTGTGDDGMKWTVGDTRQPTQHATEVR